MKSAVRVKRSDLIQTSRSTATTANTLTHVGAPKITTNADAQEDVDLRDIFCLTDIGAKETITLGITNLLGTTITNPIPVIADKTDFKTVS